MSEIARVQQYFTRSATVFDSLYADNATALAKWVNRNFRRDIYERFRLSVEHVERHGLRTALDVGCGSGRYQFGLARIGVRRIVGIDVSPVMIQLARGLSKGVASSSVSLEFMNERFETFQTKESFDVVLAMGFFDYIQDQIPVLQRMGELANHSVIASFPSISWYRTPIRKIRYFAKRCPVYFYKRKDIDSFAKAAGFARNETLKIDGAGQDYFVAFFK